MCFPTLSPMKALTIITLCLTVLVLGLLGARYGSGFKLAAPPSQEPPPPSPPLQPGDVGPVVQLDPFVVSETDEDGEHMNTVTFEVEVSDPQARDDFKARTSEIRSAILTVLADTRLSDIGDPEDFANLKKKVRARVESIVPADNVRRILITEFLSL